MMKLLLAAALPVALAAGTIPIGASSSPVVFTPSGGELGTISVGSCAANCVAGGSYAPLGLTWSLTSMGTIDYSGGPSVYTLSGNTATFALTDLQSDSLGGSVAWNTATVGASTTDVNATVTLGTVQFASDSDALALAAIAGFGALPHTGQTGSIDLVVSCGSNKCIQAEDPTGRIVATSLTFTPTPAGSTVPEPGTLVLPGLVLGLLASRRRFLV